MLLAIQLLGFVIYFKKINKAWHFNLDTLSKFPKHPWQAP